MLPDIALCYNHCCAILCHVILLHIALLQVKLYHAILSHVIFRAHSFPRQNLTNSAANLVNSAVHRGKADEVPRLNAATQLNYRG